MSMGALAVLHEDRRSTHVRDATGGALCVIRWPARERRKLSMRLIGFLMDHYGKRSNENDQIVCQRPVGNIFQIA